VIARLDQLDQEQVYRALRLIPREWDPSPEDRHAIRRYLYERRIAMLRSFGRLGIGWNKP
jgi:hypothetical protein